MPPAVLTMNSANYGAWSLRGWLLCRFAGLDVEVEHVPGDDEASRAELTMLSPSFLVPRLGHDGALVWGVLAMAEYINEVCVGSPLLPEDRIARAHCRSVCSELVSGFTDLVTALPMNVRARNSSFPLWKGARADIERISDIWVGCLETYGGPFLFGTSPTMADAIYAPECTRMVTYDVSLTTECASYVSTVLATSEMDEWISMAADEPVEFDELEVEF